MPNIQWEPFFLFLILIISVALIVYALGYWINRWK